MAKIYAPPEGFDPPEFEDAFDENGRYDYKKDDRIHQEYIERLADHARKHNKGDLVGEVVGFPIADGAAQYMVWSHTPFSLLHLPIHDAWQIPEAHARGLRLKDIRDQVERGRKMAELFGRKAEG